MVAITAVDIVGLNSAGKYTFFLVFIGQVFLILPPGWFKFHYKRPQSALLWLCHIWLDAKFSVVL